MSASHAVVVAWGSLWALGAGGCLEVQSGHRAETEEGDTRVAGDTGVVTEGDSQGTESGSDSADSGLSEADAPEVDRCADGHCDDGDPCSVDFCSAATGVCTHERVVGCHDCGAGCDDADPCTDDGCIMGSCEFQALDGCDPGCTGIGQTPLATARYAGPEGTFLTTRGTAQMGQDGMCVDSGLCMCQAGIDLVDGYESLELFPSAPDPALPADPVFTYACSSNDDASLPNHVRVECQPFLAGVGYRVWGTGSYRETNFAPGGLVPVRPLASIEVHGYCLDTGSEEALWGDYAVRVAFDNGPEVPMHATIYSVDQGELIELRPDDPNDNVVGVTGGVVEQLDNGLRFQFQTREGAPLGVAELITRLVAREGRLEGRFVSTSSARGPMWGYTGISNAGGADGRDTPDRDDFPRPASSGTIVLVRLAPVEGVRSPCP
jgi:hypothetical protein